AGHWGRGGVRARACGDRRRAGGRVAAPTARGALSSNSDTTEPWYARPSPVEWGGRRGRGSLRLLLRRLDDLLLDSSGYLFEARNLHGKAAAPLRDRA